MSRSTLLRCMRVMAPMMILPLISCGVHPIDKIIPEAEKEVCQRRPLFLDKDVDLLFVIDNSQSMALGQKNLQDNFPKLIEALRSRKLDNLIPNVRIGIISTDLGIGKYTSAGCNATGGDNGKLQNKAQVAGCSPPKNTWIDYTYNAKTKKAITNIPGALNVDPNAGILAVKNAFKCIGSIGIDGCGFEQTIEASRRALDPNMNANPGFLRNDPPGQGHCMQNPGKTCKTSTTNSCGANDTCSREDALLAVVFITDEDDCSASNPQLFDTQNTGLTDPLGPWTSFRCFEFGVTCQCGGKKCTRTTAGTRTNCVPTSAGSLYLHKIENYITFFKNLKKTNDNKPNPKRLLMAAIAGPFSGTVQTEMVANVPTLKPSCFMGNYTADPAVRIKALVHAFAQALSSTDVADIIAKKKNIPHWIDKGVYKEENFTTICTNNFAPALEQLGQRIVGALGSMCLNPPGLTNQGGIICKKGDILYEDKISGTKVICVEGCLDMADFTIQEIKTGGQTVPIKKCSKPLFDTKTYPDTSNCGSECPCWRVISDKNCLNNAGSSPYAVQIMRQGESPKGTYAYVCSVNSTDDWNTKEFAALEQCK